ncbi:MAG: acyl carrier protein [Dehalococcoidia bacterium]
MDSHLDDVRATIKSLIISIKPLEEGFDELADDAPLLKDGSGVPSPVNLDSLDALDLAMSLGDEFGLDNAEFERIIGSDSGIDSLRTVNDIADLIVSLTANRATATQAPPILERKEVKA